MRKGKRGPALFELITEGSDAPADSLRVPDWWSRRGKGRMPEAIVAGKQLPDADVDRKVAGSACSAGIVDGDVDDPQLAVVPPPERLIELTGERIRFSLTSGMAAVALFVGLAFLLVSFEIGTRRGEAYGRRVGFEGGRASYAAEVASDIETARALPPNTDLVRNLLSDPGAAEGTREEASKLAEATGWVRGHTYIVVQEFKPGRKDDGLAAQAFLWQGGFKTELVETASGGNQLITAQGYNHRDPAQKRMVEQMLQKIHTRGAEYYAQGGGYRLKGYLKTLKSDTW